MNSDLNFSSLFSDYFRSFILEKRGLGCKYRTEVAALRLFDQYICESGYMGTEIPKNYLKAGQIVDLTKEKRPVKTALTSCPNSVNLLFVWEDAHISRLSRKGFIEIFLTPYIFTNEELSRFSLSLQAHYMVVFGIKNGKFLIGDPAKGKLRMPLDAFFRLWTGYVVTFQKTEAFKPGNYTRSSLTKFLALLKGQYHKLVSVIILSLMVTSVGIVGTFVFELVIDNFASDTGFYENFDEEAEEVEHNHENESMMDQCLEMVLEYISRAGFHIIFIALLTLYLLRAVIQMVRGYLIVSVSRKIDVRLVLTYYNHITDLPMSSVLLRQTGEYLSRFSDTATIRQAISGATLTLLLDSLMAIIGGIILYRENKLLFFVAFLMVFFYAIIVLCYRKPVERSNRKVMENNAILQSYFKESIDGMETIKAACAGEEVKEKTSDKFMRFVNSAFRNSILSISQDTLADTVELVGTVVILWIGFGLVIGKQITIGSLITFNALLSYFIQPIKNLIELQPMLQTAFIAADRLNDILDLQTEVTEEGKISVLPAVSEWAFEHVDFRYGNRELALHDISLKISHGEKIAIVGESGSGKTTLAKLLVRFYSPENGRITINDTEISEYTLAALRNSVAYVGQDTFLFSDSIRNNLKLGHQEISDEELYYACALSHADEFIQELPMGYDTPLDENGANLSGGQRQRLALARAILSKPQLLILDESTSNLDTITEAAIKNTVFQFDKDLTCIIIAHRLATVKNCDRIYVMDGGEVIECGTHEALIQKGGKYAALWDAQ